MFVKIPVQNKKTGKKEEYLLSIENINYLRVWKEDKSPDKTVLYLKSTEKYIIVDMELNELAARIQEKKDQDLKRIMTAIHGA